MLSSLFFFFFFFFSSRRRHTRFDCDWSSDVCSSDLFAKALRSEALAPDTRCFGKTGFQLTLGTSEAIPGTPPQQSIIKGRSSASPTPPLGSQEVMRHLSGPKQAA